MAVYPALDRDAFMRLVRAANPTYERVRRSSLRPLIAVLDDPAGTPQRVCEAIGRLPPAKTAKYIDPLYYLLATYPHLPLTACERLNLGELQKTQAHLYRQAALPGNYRPDAVQQADRVFATTDSIAPQRLTLEQFILKNPGVVGVLLIHLSSEADGMELQFGGRSTLTHIISVLRIARLMRCPLCALTMDANAVVHAPMKQEYDQFAGPVRVCEEKTHTTDKPDFTNFVTGLPNLVVMGFDAGVCVFANVFGCKETNADGSFRPPLLTQANIVMSRAGLVTNGTVWSAASASMGRAEYGPLYDT